MAGRKKAGRQGYSSVSKDFLTLSCKVLPTKETFRLEKVLPDITIRQLKSDCELATGIPYHLQRLHYLDEGDLLEHTDVKSNDIVTGGVLHMDVWNTWHALVEAAATNDRDALFKLGVSQDSSFQTPNSEYMSPKSRAGWVADRAFIALFIASHRGYKKLCQKLIAAGADVNGNTSQGRSALHVAAAKDNGFIVDLLLEKGADIDAADKNGDTALSIANRFGNKGCERHLFLFRWQQRAKQLTPQGCQDLFAHQYFDSAFPVWLKGDQAQVYFTQILPPGEFEGSGLAAPRRAGSGRESHAQEYGDGKEEQGVANQQYGDISKTSDRIITNWQQGDSHVQQQMSMPAIEEESASPTSDQSQLGGSRSRSAVRISAHQDMPARSSKSHHLKGAGKSGQDSTEGFNEWLQRKQAAEQRVIERQKKELAKQQQLEEDKRRREDIQDKSYETWLAEKETGKKGQPRPTGGSSGPNIRSKGSKATVTADAIIQNILRRRQEDGHDLSETWLLNRWLEDRESGQLLEHIRAGTTPLQLRLRDQSS